MDEAMRDRIRRSHLSLTRIEQDLNRHQGHVEFLAHPDLEEALNRYVAEVKSYQDWLEPYLRDAGIIE